MPEENNLLKKFIRTLILLIEARSLVKDEFFQNKLNNKIVDLGVDILNFQLGEDRNNFSQRQLITEKSLTKIAELTESLKEMEYLNLIKNRPLLLKTEYGLLDIKFFILKTIKNVYFLKEEKSEHAKRAVVDKKNAGFKNEFKKNYELTDTKKKILDFIKSYPNTRTKDRIYELNMISGRTIKRNLIDLLKSGFLSKRVDNKAVYYYASE